MKTLKTKLRAVIMAAVVLMLVAQPVMAQGLVPCGTRSEDNQQTGAQEGACEWSDLFELAYRIVNYLIGMAGFVAIMFIVWGGLQMLLSAGNTSKVQEAKSTVQNAILGLVLTLLAYLIVGYVAGLLLPGGSGGTPIERILEYLPNNGPQ
jgi:hypothetical protein